MNESVQIKSFLSGNGGSESSLRKPAEIGRFSLDGHRQFHHDRRQMSCFAPPLVNGRLTQELDLNDGYGTPRFIKRDEEVKERLEHMLEWVLINRSRFVDHRRSKRAKTEPIIGEYPDFLLWRGHVTKLMCTPFENRDGWMMAAQKVNGTIYVSEIESDSKARERRNRSGREELMTYWGVRFEGFMSGPFARPGSQREDHSKTVTNTNKAFCSVVRTRLNGRHSMVYGAEVDCCHQVEVINPPDCYVELKTSRKFTSAKQEDNFYRYKALKWWAQSYLAGVPQITCGFRDDEGFVSDIQDFDTFQLPQRAGRLRNSWDSKTCLNFLDNILQWIKEKFSRLKDGDCNDVIIFTRDPGSPDIKCKLYKSPTQFQFLPQKFIDEFA